MNPVTRRASNLLWPVLAVVIALALWQALTAGGVFRPDQFPTMSSTMVAFAEEFSSAKGWLAVWATLQGWFLGLVIASVAALVLGSALAFSTFAFRSASTVIELFKAIPAIAILPLITLVLGSTLDMKVFLVAFGVFWPLIIQVIYGVRSMDPTVLDTAKALGVRGVRRFLVVTVPSAAPYIATGLRIASASALILAVVAEIIAGADGIGRQILLAQNGGMTTYPRMYAYILMSGMLGLALTGAFFLIERKAMHWHESQRNITSNEERPAR
ncbi:ABC transporter permease [Microbacterium pseudoresistens]|uniref:ABC-type nitrate/sulfonate/bicarbonate transport system permease component n=1 Tax=Microbacterium pseudoresistens TaxID=640634 RepID=A0A7Y9EXK8_9MICO|nr:ABC transporter permease [Microbacterium pseudoresistens]NYD54920.1 ABC-type nitrate/sulfonate/bicarbonate transport system permease component [Microbacterium pseudoresistens]